MKKRVALINKLILIGCFSVFSSILSAQSVGELFKRIPDEMCPTLSKQNRIELIEYFTSGHGDSIANRFGRNAHMLVLDTLNDYIAVASTPISTFEMTVLTRNVDQPLVLVVRTVCGPICKSFVEVYDTTWVKKNLNFKIPTSIEWIKKEAFENSNLDIEWVKRVLGNSFVSLKIDIGSNSIIATNNIISFLSDEEKKLIVPLLEDKTIPIAPVSYTHLRLPTICSV